MAAPQTEDFTETRGDEWREPLEFFADDGETPEDMTGWDLMRAQIRVRPNASAVIAEWLIELDDLAAGLVTLSLDADKSEWFTGGKTYYYDFQADIADVRTTRLSGTISVVADITEEDDG